MLIGLGTILSLLGGLQRNHSQSEWNQTRVLLKTCIQNYFFFLRSSASSCVSESGIERLWFKSRSFNEFGLSLVRKAAICEGGVGGGTGGTTWPFSVVIRDSREDIGELLGEGAALWASNSRISPHYSLQSSYSLPFP